MPIHNPMHPNQTKIHFNIIYEERNINQLRPQYLFEAKPIHFHLDSKPTNNQWIQNN